MVSFVLSSLLMCISLTMALPPNDIRPDQTSLKRLARNVDQHYLRQFLGKVLDDEKPHFHPNDDSVTLKYFEDSACLEACYKCVEDYPAVAVSVR